ncbi:hypothetical protein D3C76_1520940 [compost metagenome]
MSACGHCDQFWIFPADAPSELHGLSRVGVPAVIGQAAIHEECIRYALKLPACHALYVTLLNPIDRAADNHVQRVLHAFRNAGNRLDEAIGDVLVPGHKLLLRQVGQAQQQAVITDIPNN